MPGLEAWLCLGAASKCKVESYQQHAGQSGAASCALLTITKSVKLAAAICQDSLRVLVRDR